MLYDVILDLIKLMPMLFVFNIIASQYCCQSDAIV